MAGAKGLALAWPWCSPPAAIKGPPGSLQRVALPTPAGSGAGRGAEKLPPALTPAPTPPRPACRCGPKQGGAGPRSKLHGIPALPSNLPPRPARSRQKQGGWAGARRVGDPGTEVHPCEGDQQPAALAAQVALGSALSGARPWAPPRASRPTAPLPRGGSRFGGVGGCDQGFRTTLSTEATLPSFLHPGQALLALLDRAEPRSARSVQPAGFGKTMDTPGANTAGLDRARCEMGVGEFRPYSALMAPAVAMTPQWRCVAA